MLIQKKKKKPFSEMSANTAHTKNFKVQLISGCIIRPAGLRSLNLTDPVQSSKAI